MEDRRNILIRAIETPVHPDYMFDFEEWEYGQPFSNERIHRITGLIAGHIRLRGGSMSKTYEYAIKDWMSDLEFLCNKYYKTRCENDEARIHWIYSDVFSCDC